MNRRVPRVRLILALTTVTGWASLGHSSPGLSLPSAGFPVCTAQTISTSGSSTEAPSSQARVVPGSKLWAARYDGPAHGGDHARSVAVGPDGTRVFVTGDSGKAGSGLDYATIAYDRSTGARAWVSRFDGGVGDDSAVAVAISPDGSRVYVTGWSFGTPGIDYATVAYDAGSGAQLWATRYHDGNDDKPVSMTVSADGSRVFVTGQSIGISDWLYLTVGYDASTGGQVWAASYLEPGTHLNFGQGIGVSPDGSRVFVTGHVEVSDTEHVDTLAYDSTTGTTLWTSVFISAPILVGFDYHFSLAVSPDGERVFVTGQTAFNQSLVYLTIAYDAATGGQIWTNTYDGPNSGLDAACAIRVSPDGTRVFVTGFSTGAGTSYDYATVAYDAATGAQLWVARYDGPGHAEDEATSMAVRADGSTVFVTGASTGSGTGLDYATVAYDASTGSQVWASRFDGPGHDSDWATSVAVTPDGKQVDVTGYSTSTATGLDYATIAYRS
jgi:WD40 repeat protein